MSNGYKYDAFISYRHADLDKFVAENLHRKLESYKVSKKVISNGRARRSRIERVFRDKDELPITNNLEDPIIQALQQSEYLLVICTPRLKESIWCKKEIETFISMHGRDKIFAVLAEGEPQESFPEEILYREGQVQYPDGTIGMGLIPAEPLAADVRGKSKKEILKAMDVEVLRLLAPMLGVEFDDLKQRHRERKFKKIITATVAAAVLCLGIGIASTITALHINKQKEKIEAQSVEIQAQADEIASQSDAIVAQNEQLLENQAKNLAEESLELLDEGDRMAALEVAVSALTEYEGLLMPYTAEARYALSESLYHYDAAQTAKPVFQMVMSGTIEYYCVSSDEKYLACVDRTGEVVVWNLETGDKIQSIVSIDGVYGDKSLCFIDNVNLIYVMDGEICKYNLETNQVDAKVTNDNVDILLCDQTGQYVVSRSYNDISIYKVTESEIEFVATITPREGYKIENGVFISSQGILVYSESKNEDIESLDDTNQPEVDESQPEIEESQTYLKFYTLDQGEDTLEIPLDNMSVNDIVFEGDFVYCSAHDLYNNQGGVLLKIDTKSGDIIWENNELGFVSKIYLSDVEGGNIMLPSGLGIYCVNGTTGALEVSLSVANSVVGMKKLSGTNRFELFFSNGDYGQYIEDYGEYAIYPDAITHNFQSISDVCILETGYIIIPINGNKLVYYENTVGEEIMAYEGEEDWNIGLDEEDVYAVIEDMNKDKTALVQYITYSDDKSLAFVSYIDGVFEIYDNNTKECLAEIDGINYGKFQYYGKDNEGNIYVSNLEYGYIFDSEYNLISRVQSMVGMDAQRNIIIIEAGAYKYAYPIYTTEQLIGKALQILN